MSLSFSVKYQNDNARQFCIVMAWSVDRLGCSLQDLVAFLSDLDRHHDTRR